MNPLKIIKPQLMSDDEILEEVVDTVRVARSHGAWDRKRLRALSAEAQKRGLIDSKKPSELIRP
jgi:hypothetical protein